MRWALVVAAALVVAVAAWSVGRGTIEASSPDDDRPLFARQTGNAMRDAVWVECDELYGDAPLEELEAELTAVKDSVRALTNPIYDDRFAVGAYDVEGEYVAGVPYRITPQPDVLASRRMMPNGLVGIVALRQQDHPDAYEQMYRGQWIRHRINYLEEYATLGR